MKNFNIKNILNILLKILAIIIVITILFIRDIVIRDELKELKTRVNNQYVTKTEYYDFKEKQTELNVNFYEILEELVKIFGLAN